ncbi:response regulator [Methanoregula sp.]|uniref:response regulator n=1 Tax=Methanoregula sp. TaxID=2052170 RepID=UPI002C80578F|nr:response regulator [Methanoregula sp.]HVP97440.1 response regulator [Methanoregula sp.]
MIAPLKVFFLEDDQQMAELLDLRLKQMGYHVCGKANNVEAAVSSIQECKPDIALIDIELQGQNDGLAIGDYLLNNTDIPFVYMTGHDEAKILEMARRTVPDGYLLKPFDDRQLRVAVEMAMRRG